MFRFAHPEYFWLLVVIPLLVAVFAWSAWRRRRRLEQFGDPATVAALIPDASPGRHFTKFMFLLTSVTLIVVALARPQLGSKLKEVTVSGIELMLVVLYAGRRFRTQPAREN